eukprot:scaffold69646_cov15-Prasinocladus_malaysianus.AAC.1
MQGSRSCRQSASGVVSSNPGWHGFSLKCVFRTLESQSGCEGVTRSMDVRANRAVKLNAKHQMRLGWERVFSYKATSQTSRWIAYFRSVAGGGCVQHGGHPGVCGRADER